MRSLITRVLFAASMVLVVFLGLTIGALEIAFRSVSERAASDRLQIQVLALLATAEINGDGAQLFMPDTLAEPRFSHPGSGLFAQILDHHGGVLWRSPSAVAAGLPVPSAFRPGESEFKRDVMSDGSDVFRYGLTILWDTGEEGINPPMFHFMVAESMDSYFAQVARFRANLLWWFGLLLLAQIVAQLFILRRTLRPLRDLAGEVAAIEAGRQDFVQDRYPRELSRLANNLNALIRNERGHLERYRNTLGDLAHSLKTPLAVVRVALEERPDQQRDAIIEQQVERMNEIVRYQLQRASAVGSETFGRAVVVAPSLNDVVGSLQKVYASKNLVLRTNFHPEAVFLGSRGDLLEMAGNLMDNACKWARSSVRVTAEPLGERGLVLTVEDDGPGIPPEKRAVVLDRGARMDESADGQGIGLAVVRDIARHHGGSVTLDTSDLGGLKVTVTFCDNP